MTAPVRPVALRATVRSEVPLPLPSASGIELVGPTAYVIADDAPFLYLLHAETLAPAGQVRLFATADFGTGRLPKAAKPDLEALTGCDWPGRGFGLLLLGSGSAPNRRTGYWVPLAAAAVRPVAVPPAGPAAGSGPVPPADSGTVGLVQPLDLQRLYTAALAACPPGTALNIEAAAATATELLLLHRGVGAGAAALVLRWPLAAALASLDNLGDDGTPAPRPTVLALALPEVAGCRAGLSGATVAPDGRLWLTASVENTRDPVLDGAVLGSFVGVLDLDKPASAARFARLAWADGRPYLGKVEGLAWRENGDLLLVTDDDKGGSTALVASIDEE